jgi:hypothetical protein
MSDYMLMHMCMIFHFWDLTFFFLNIFFFGFLYILNSFQQKKMFLNNKNYDLQVIFNASIFCIIKTYTTVIPCETMTTH